MATRNQLIRLFGSLETYNSVKAIVLDCTGEWHEDQEITAETSMFAEDDGSEDATIPNFVVHGSEDPTEPRAI